MNATVSLAQRMTFHGEADSGFSVRLDSSPSVGGDNSGFRPMELMLISLGGCTAMDVISILRKKRQNITDFVVKLDANQADDHPHVFTDVTIHYVVYGHGVSAKAVERAIELSETKYCPAQAMLGEVATIEHTYEIVEANDED
ncbi:MAG: OsmC family protein [Candidatus Promineifilaceae bacterium]|nr:OsmC family protein [Candidatus Promineifilaceae bacterium]